MYLDGRAIFFFFFSFVFVRNDHSTIHMVEREQFYRPKINLYQITSTFVRQRMNVNFQYHKSKKKYHMFSLLEAFANFATSVTCRLEKSLPTTLIIESNKVYSNTLGPRMYPRFIFFCGKVLRTFADWRMFSWRTWIGIRQNVYHMNNI